MTEVRVNSLYEACHSLRFTGRLELRDTHHQAQVVFLGGEPVEIVGGDTQVIALWTSGQFRAVQSIPNLTGELTGQIEQAGSLALTKAPRLLAWVLEYRLSCDLTIERTGEKAELAFKNGQLESALVNGAPELAALARVQSWTDGHYRIHLRPLFSGGIISLNPDAGDGLAPEGRVFDVSRAIPLDLRKKAALAPPPDSTVTVGETTQRDALAAARMARLSSGTDPVAPLSERIVEPDDVPTKQAPWTRVAVVLIIAGTVTGGVLYAVPQFSAAPRFDDAPQASPPRPVAPPAAKPALVEPAAAKPAAAEPVAPPPAVEPVAEKPAVAAAEPEKADLAPADPAALEPKPTPGTPSAAPPSSQSTDERMIEKGRLLLVDGHPHSALSLFRKAEQANPKNELARTLQQQALGKLGRAELWLEGKGSVTVDGKVFDAPKKLHLFAGPHAIDNGAGVEELTLKKGERRKLRVRS